MSSDPEHLQMNDNTDDPYGSTEKHSESIRSDDATPEHQFPASPLPFLPRLRDFLSRASGPLRSETSGSSSEEVPSPDRVPDGGEGGPSPSGEPERGICRYCGCPIDETAGCPARATRGCEA